MSSRPRALKNMLVGKRKNDEMKLKSLTLSVYYTDDEKKAIIKKWLKDGRILRLI